MASVTTRKWSDGSVSHRFRVRLKGLEFTETFECKGRRGCEGGCKGGQDGQVWAAEKEREIRLGSVIAGTNHTLDDVIEYFLKKELKQRYKSVEQQEKVATQIEWWREQLGGKRKLSDITKTNIADAKLGLALGKTSPSRRPLSGSTLNRYHNTIAVLWETAQRKLAWVNHNPVGEVLRDDENEKRKRWLDADEQKALLEAALEGRDGEHCHLWILAALTTGARRGELEKVAWRNVNFEDGTIKLEDRKNGSDGLVSLHPEVAAALRKRQAAVQLREAPFGEFPETDYENAVKRARLNEKSTCAKDKVVFHTLRHSCATALAASGIGARELQNYMGWKTAAMADTYVHPHEGLTSALRKAVSQLF